MGRGGWWAYTVVHKFTQRIPSVGQLHRRNLSVIVQSVSQKWRLWLMFQNCCIYHNKSVRKLCLRTCSGPASFPAPTAQTFWDRNSTRHSPNPHWHKFLRKYWRNPWIKVLSKKNNKNLLINLKSGQAGVFLCFVILCTRQSLVNQTIRLSYSFTVTVDSLTALKWLCLPQIQIHVLYYIHYIATWYSFRVSLILFAQKKKQWMFTCMWNLFAWKTAN